MMFFSISTKEETHQCIVTAVRSAVLICTLRITLLLITVIVDSGLLSFISKSSLCRCLIIFDVLCKATIYNIRDIGHVHDVTVDVY